jgi:hypothetical protein
MKPIRWSGNALRNLADREIDRTEADKTLAEPELVAPGEPPRQLFMRRYFDDLLQQEMLLRFVVEETTSEQIVVTVYKTAQIGRYLKGRTP